MKRRGFLSLFSLLFARPTAALVKPVPVDITAMRYPFMPVPWPEMFPGVPTIKPLTLDLMYEYRSGKVTATFSRIVDGERPQDIPMELNGSCRQHKEGSLNA
jgi:hypothetical protein